MTSLLLIFRFPNPDRGSAAKHILESFSKRQRRKDMLTNCQLIVAVSKRFHLMVSHSIVWYCMVFLHCMPTHLWCIKAVSLLLPCRRPVIPPVSQLIYTLHSTVQEKEQCTPIPKNTYTYTNRNRLD